MERECEQPTPPDFGNFPDWVKKVYDSHRQQSESDAKNWHSPMFYLARFIRAHPTVTKLRDFDAMQKVEQVIREWLPRKAVADPWEYFFPEAGSGDAARLDFMTSWNAIRHIPWNDVLSNALRLADEHPLQSPNARPELHERLLSLAGWLQVLMQEKPILLPTRRLGKLLGCDQRTISRMIKLAKEDGLLVIVKRYSYQSSGKSEATEYRFAIERYPQLMGEQ